MTSKVLKIGKGIGLLLALQVSQAGASGNIEYDYATVIDAEPIFQTVQISEPRRQCWQEQVRYRDGYSNGGTAVQTVMGGVIGGALGNAVGHRKRNRQVGAVVGAVLGATISNAYASKRKRYDEGLYVNEEVCEIVEESHMEEQIVGYNVRYRYSNSTYTTRTDVDPGDTIKVRIAISPVL